MGRFVDSCYAIWIFDYEVFPGSLARTKTSLPVSYFPDREPLAPDR